MIVMKCYVRFNSSMDLRTVAALISEHLFGGVPFADTDEFDEVPGVRLERTVLMLSASICGDAPEFGLRVRTELPIFGPGAFPKLDYLDLNGYIEQSLASLKDKDIEIVPT